MIEIKGYRAVVHSSRAEVIDGTERITPDEQSFFRGVVEARRWMRAKADARACKATLFAQHETAVEQYEPEQEQCHG